MAANAPSQFTSLCCWRDDKGAAVRLADLSCNKSAVNQTIENARQCRSLVSESAVEVGNTRRRGMREQRKDVRLTLCQLVLAQLTQIKSDPVRGPVDWMNKVQWHRQEAVSGPAQPRKFEPCH